MKLPIQVLHQMAMVTQKTVADGMQANYPWINGSNITLLWELFQTALNICQWCYLLHQLRVSTSQSRLWLSSFSISSAEWPISLAIVKPHIWNMCQESWYAFWPNSDWWSPLCGLALILCKEDKFLYQHQFQLKLWCEMLEMMCETNQIFWTLNLNYVYQKSKIEWFYIICFEFFVYFT